MSETEYQAYVVVGLEFESSTPGIYKVFGPWRSYDEADRFADQLCEEHGWIRGANLQVASVETNV